MSAPAGLDLPGLELAVPELSLVVLIGVSGSGKSTWSDRVFEPFEVISSDFCRGLVSGDENSQEATKAAFEVLHFIAGKRLEAGKLTVIDATNVQRDARAKLIQLAKSHDVLPVAIVLDTPQEICVERTLARTDRHFGEEVIRRQSDQLRRSMRGLRKEGFRKVHTLSSPAQMDAAVISRERLLTDYRDQHGPFDVIGDVHGCRIELERLLVDLGYTLHRDEQGRAVDASHAAGRRCVFVGDLVDRGPDSVGVLRLVMGMVGAGHALCVPGNHEAKMVKALQGRDVTASHGLAETLDQLAQEPPDFSTEVLGFCDGLVSHLILDNGHLVVAHAGLKESFQGRASARVRAFALYGDTTGETDEFGLPVRYPWATEYRGAAMVLYGHTPTPTPEWINNTMCLDTGCVFGGELTAMRYPERELVSVAADQVWYEPIRPLQPAAIERDPNLLDITDVLGKRIIETDFGRITVREENAAGALEVMSRFAMDPRWLPYLPPTMSPCATSSLPDYLEFPTEAFQEYRRDGVTEVICEEKHMGSRAVVLICRDGEVASRRFSAKGTPGFELSDEVRTGAVYTRTGRAFFGHDLTETFLSQLRAAVDDCDLWSELGTDWLLLDAELLPWSAKAEELLKSQYASVGAAAGAALPVAVAALQAAADRGVVVQDLLAVNAQRLVNARAFVDTYRRYHWPVAGLRGVRLAPFQVLASEGLTFHDRRHDWHLGIADRLVEAAPDFMQATGRIVVDTSNDESVGAGIDWWLTLTAAGGEGMVVKPMVNFGADLPRSVQPGIKVRGKEYLRIIYGADYTMPVNLDRLKQRGLGRKRSLALREYGLGLAALQRLAAGEPLWRVHEAVFAVLALESEPVDPRL